MRLWRIAQQKYALDKSCARTVQFGGRWNPVGLPALYASTSISLCSLEKFIHIGLGARPTLVLVAIDIPDTVPVYVSGSAALAANWDALPVSAAAHAFGGGWLARATELAMRVPSVIVPEEDNVVVKSAAPCIWPRRSVHFEAIQL